MPHEQLPIPLSYVKRGDRSSHLILHPPQQILEVFHRVTITHPLLLRAVDSLYDLQCVRTISRRPGLGEGGFCCHV